MFLFALIKIFINFAPESLTKVKTNYNRITTNYTNNKHY